MVMLTTNDTTVCPGFMLCGRKATFLMDYTNTDTSVWVAFVDPKNQRGGSHIFHTDYFVEAGETDYLNSLVEKVIVMK